MQPTASSQPAAVRRATPMLMPTSGRPCTKFVVPSIGSTIHRNSDSDASSAARSASADAFGPAATDSSPRKPWSGNLARTRCSMISCTATSTSVSRSPREAFVFITSAPNFAARAPRQVVSGSIASASR